MKTKNGKECWAQSDDKYLAASVENMESNLKKCEHVNGLQRKNKCLTPLRVLIGRVRCFK